MTLRHALDEEWQLAALRAGRLSGFTAGSHLMQTPTGNNLRRRTPLRGLVVGSLFLLADCHPPQGQNGDAGANAEAAALPSPSAVHGAARSPSGADDEVRPVYPVDLAPVDPLALRFCEVVNAVEEERRALCCREQPGLVFTGECARTLSAALRAKAVTLDPADVDACAVAVNEAYAGCDWTGPHPPRLPEACGSVVRGTLPAAAICRSTLECAGEFHCHGVGPTDPGRCAPPHAGADACGGSVDSLVTYTRQGADRTHGECAGYCDRRRCASLARPGGACASDLACGSGMHCAAGACAKAGAPRAATESARKPTGAACAQDIECTGGCVFVDGSATGRCGPKCGAR